MATTTKTPKLAPLDLRRDQIYAIVTACVELAQPGEISPKSPLVRRFGGVDSMLERRQLLQRAWEEIPADERTVLRLLAEPMKGHTRRPGANEVLAMLLAGETPDSTSEATIVRGSWPELTLEVVLAVAARGRQRIRTSPAIRELLAIEA